MGCANTRGCTCKPHTQSYIHTYIFSYIITPPSPPLQKKQPATATPHSSKSCGSNHWPPGPAPASATTSYSKTQTSSGSRIRLRCVRVFFMMTGGLGVVNGPDGVKLVWSVHTQTPRTNSASSVKCLFNPPTPTIKQTHTHTRKQQQQQQQQQTNKQTNKQTNSAFSTTKCPRRTGTSWTSTTKTYTHIHTPLHTHPQRLLHHQMPPKDGYFMDDGARSARFAPYFVRATFLIYLIYLFIHVFIYFIYGYRWGGGYSCGCINIYSHTHPSQPLSQNKNKKHKPTGQLTHSHTFPNPFYKTTHTQINRPTQGSFSYGTTTARSTSSSRSSSPRYLKKRRRWCMNFGPAWISFF